VWIVITILVYGHPLGFSSDLEGLIHEYIINAK
jgi:hypothetical protein